MRLADGLAVALAASLPWSTSATSALAVLLLIAIVPTLDLERLRPVLLSPAGGLPVLLWLLALVGMLWAFDVPLADRLNGLKSFHKLLFIPLLMAHAQRSERGAFVMHGFLVSCTVLLAASWFLIFVPEGIRGFVVPRGGPAVPAKDYIAQNGEFAVCVFLLAAIALDAWNAQRRQLAAAVLLLVAAFVVNMLIVPSSRTALVVMPVLLVLFACRNLPRRGAVALLLAGLVIGGIGWALSPALRSNVDKAFNEVHEFRPDGQSTRAGERLEFWRKSIGFVEAAPLIGHGTGSIRDQFRRSSAGQSGMAALVAENPHNQTLAVGIQLGLLGAAALFALWMAHLLLFRGGGFAAWAGLVIVAQNIVGSLFNSHLFDFTQGWGYVIGVGIAGGMMLKKVGSGPDIPRA